MKAYVFPGQGAQFPGMGKDLYENSDLAKKRFEQANEILGFSITDIMFGEDPEALKETRVTQPAIFLHATLLSEVMGDRFQPEMVAGHSLGEFSALVAAGVFPFENGLRLVQERALAMQAACDEVPGTMAAILGLDDQVVESVWPDTCIQDKTRAREATCPHSAGGSDACTAEFYWYFPPRKVLNI